MELSEAIGTDGALQEALRAVVDVQGLSCPPPTTVADSQDDAHPELSAAMKIRVDDLLHQGHHHTRAAILRDLQRSALQVYREQLPGMAEYVGGWIRFRSHVADFAASTEWEPSKGSTHSSIPYTAVPKSRICKYLRMFSESRSTAISGAFTSITPSKAPPFRLKGKGTR